MASQQIKNELNNELETLLLEAKFEVRKEGKRRLEELKEQIPTPPEIIAILKAELSENACSIAGIEKFMAKAQDLTELDPQIQIAKLQAEIQMKREELELRRQLSADTNGMRRGQSDTQAAVKMATTAIKQ